MYISTTLILLESCQAIRFIMEKKKYCVTTLFGRYSRLNVFWSLHILLNICAESAD